jgi:hypothetical protein
LKKVVVRSLPELKKRSDDCGVEPTIRWGAPKMVQVALASQLSLGEIRELTPRHHVRC